MVFGLICVILGAGIWLLNIYGGGFNWGRDWPFLLLVFGLYIFWDHMRKRKKKNGKRVKNILKKLENKEIDFDKAIDELEES
jgi:thiol:disulfide interchange protein